MKNDREGPLQVIQNHSKSEPLAPNGKIFMIWGCIGNALFCVWGERQKVCQNSRNSKNSQFVCRPGVMRGAAGEVRHGKWIGETSFFFTCSNLGAKFALSDFNDTVD